MKRFPAIGTRLRDMHGIVWTVIESLDTTGILESQGLWRKASVERIAGWVVLR